MIPEWNWGATENVHLLKIKGPTEKEYPLRSLDMGRERKRWKSANTWKQRCRSSSPLGSHRLFLKKSVQFSHSIVSNSLRPHGLQHTRLPVHHQFLKLAQTHVHQVSDAIQPSHPLSSHLKEWEGDFYSPLPASPLQHFKPGLNEWGGWGILETTGSGLEVRGC